MIKVSFLGDIMCEKEFNRFAYDGSNYSYESIFDNVKGILSTSDYVVGNLETPIAGEDLIYTNHKWSFNTPESFLSALKNINIGFLSTANNHCLDRGENGLCLTYKALTKYGFDHSGIFINKSDDKRFFIKELHGVKFGILSYTYGTNALFNKNYLKKSDLWKVNLFKYQEPTISKKNLFKRIALKFGLFAFNEDQYIDRLKNDILELKARGADFIILCMHSGGQHNEKVDLYTKKLVEKCMLLGVDIIIGTHPHVVLDSYFSLDKIFTYSLGNFCSFPGGASTPIDSFADYSIVLHLYFSKSDRKIEKATFSIFKCVNTDALQTRVYNTSDLYEILDEQAQIVLLEDINYIHNKFTGYMLSIAKTKQEYCLDL